jgi:GMP synthase-like glutamine amidotransferase
MQVWEAPLGAEVLASSDKTGVEMFCVGDHVLGIQGHPEYTADILLSLVDRLSSAQSITVSSLSQSCADTVNCVLPELRSMCHFARRMQVSFAEGVKRQLEATGPDREFWLTLCKSFLKTQELP